MKSSPIYDVEEQGVRSSVFDGESFYSKSSTNSPSGSVKVETTFGREPSLMTWYSKSPFKFAGACDTSDKAIYTVPSDIDYLLDSYLYVKTPEIWLKPEFADEHRICFTSYLGYSIIVEATVTHGDIAPRITPYYCVSYLQHNAGRKQKSYMKRAGQSPLLTDWTTRIKSYELTPYQPWWYGSRPWSAFPAGEMTSGTTHDYQYNLNILDHLRMKKRVNGQWIDINPADNVSMLEGIPTGGKFPGPELCGTWAKITSDEKEARLEQSEGPVPVYIDTVLSFSDETKHDYDANIVKELDTNNMMIKSIYLSACNVASKANHEYFDMTIRPAVERCNMSAIESVTMRYRKTTIKFSLRAIEMQGAARDEDCENTPVDPGYLAYSNSREASRPGMDVGTVPKQGTTSVSVKLRKKESDFSHSNYLLHLDVLVTMKGKIRGGRFELDTVPEVK